MIATRLAFRAVPQLQHSVRHYATEGSSPGGMNKWVKYVGGAFGASLVAFGVLRALAPRPDDEEVIRRLEMLSGKKPGSNPANKTFKGGDQGWLDLKLESVEELSHNTKKLRFALPDKDDVSGLEVASALLTKFKGPEMEKVRGPTKRLNSETHHLEASDQTIHSNKQ
ncbi:MAG: hypothetical protein Q9186_003310 [Xanthomendoza sp. 1 TL-2023]